MRVAETLSLDNKNGLVQNAAREFASWAIIGEAHGQYQFPPVLTQAAGDLYAGTKAEIRPAPGQAGHLLNAALLDVQSPSLLRDYVHALALDFSSGGVAGPLQFTQMLSKIIQLNKDSQGFPLWLSVVLSSDASSKLTGSSWYADYLKNYRESMRSGSQLASRQLPGPKQLVVDGVPFLGVAGGTFVMGQDEASTTSTDPMLVPSKIAVSSFYMMPTEVSRGMFARFLRANPEWLPGNRNSLEAAGKVTAGYLQGWSDSGVPPSGTADLPVTGVSAVAAGAYAAWLNSQQPGAVGGYEVRLPTEAEWEYAARVNRSRSQDGVFQDTVAATPREPQPVGSGKAGSIGIFDLLGNVWEWTASAYRPAEPPLTRVGANGDSAGGVALADPLAAALPTAHRTVKGGSFANRSDMVSPATRGSLPPDWCTPYLGFRVVIAPKL
jgi:formylglycine-generating enzyme required for sulfatase activity